MSFQEHGFFARLYNAGIIAVVTEKGMQKLKKEKSIITPFELYESTSFEIKVSEKFNGYRDSFMEEGMGLDLLPENTSSPQGGGPPPIRSLYRLTITQAWLDRLEQKEYIGTRSRVDRIEIGYECL